MAGQEAGAIKGRLLWGGVGLPRAEPKPAAVCAVGAVPDESIVVDPATKGVANGFAYLVGPTGSNPAAERALLARVPEVVVDQRSCRFAPHAVAVHTGQRLVFTSHDPVPHTVGITTSRNGSLNAMVSVGDKVSMTFVAAERGPVPFVCNIHPWMAGSFMVFDHPFFAVTRPDGSFEIAGVPAGARRLVVRQEASGFATAGGPRGVEVVVEPGKTTDVGAVTIVPRP